MLEQELARLLAEAGLAGRQVDAVAARLGWDGNGTRTLQAAASAHGYTRERVRQLEAKLQRQLADGLRPPLRALDRALDAIEAAAPDDRRHVARLLADAGVSAAPFDPAGVLSAAELLGLRTTVMIDGYLVRSRHGAAPDETLLAVSRTLAAERGDVSVILLARCAGHDPDRIRRLLKSRDEMAWLPGGRLAVRNPATERRLERILKKVFSVTPLLSLAEIDDALRRAFNPISLTPELLLEACAALPWLHIDAAHSTIRSRTHIDPRQVLSPVELTLTDIFEREGPELTYRKVVPLALAQDINRNTLGGYLRHTPVLKTLSRGRYALRGDRTTQLRPRNVNQAAEAA